MTRPSSSTVPTSDPRNAPAASFSSRRERIAHERADRRSRARARRRPSPRRALHAAVAATSALGLLTVVALPLMTVSDGPARATAPAPAHAHGSQRATGVAGASSAADRDAYSATVPPSLLQPATTGDERLLDTGQLADQPWALPVVGHITDGFGPRPAEPVPGVRPFHDGTDLGTACGTPIHAATKGTVVQAGRDGTYGNWILLEHGDGIQTGYAHIEDGGIEVVVGQNVDAGQEIARVGATGAATGCHLHFETRIGGSAVDAVPFMARRGITLG